MEEEEFSRLVNWLQYYRPTESFLCGYLNSFDLCVLRLTSMKLRLVLPPQSFNGNEIPLINCAIQRGEFRIAEWCLNNDFYFAKMTLKREFCKISNKREEESQKLVLSRIFPTDNSMTQYCAQENNFNLLTWFYDSNYPIHSLPVCFAAARNGNLEMIQWTCEKSYLPWDKMLCNIAAEGGHLKIIKWARAQSYPWDEQTCASAALHGNWEILKWAHLNGCPWNESTFVNATKVGQLDILQWLLESGCPWETNKCEEIAAREGHYHIVKWLQDIKNVASVRT